MSNEALIVCLFLWIIFCLLLAACASFEGRSIFLVIIVSVLFTPLTGLFVLLYLSWKHQAAKLRGCPYCLQPIQPAATACHHCLRAIPAIYIKDRPKAPPVFIYCFSGIGILGGVVLMIALWPASFGSSTTNDTNSSAANYQPSTPNSPQAEPSEPPPPPPRPTFGKDWVMVNGQQISGITKILPAPDDQVTLITSESGQNVSRADLPKGFLEQWSIPSESTTASAP